MPRGAREVAADDHVTVLGPVRELDVDQMKRDYDWAGRLLRPEVASRFEQRPVVIAESVRSSTGTELTGAQNPATMPGGTDHGASDAGPQG